MSTATQEQREQAQVLDFRSNTERDAEILRLSQELRDTTHRLWAVERQLEEMKRER